MRFYLHLWLLIWPLLGFSQDFSEQNNPQNLIHIAAEDNWPPFSDEYGKGLSEDLVRAAFATQGYQISTVVVPYARALHFTSLGIADACWNVTRQISTQRDFILHKTPLFSAASSFYYYRKAMPYLSVTQIPDAAVVGVIIGYEYGDLFEQHKQRFRLVEVSTHAQLIALLDTNKLDLAIFFDEVLQHYLTHDRIKASHIRRGALHFTSEIYLAFDKADPLSGKRADALDAGIAQLKKSGVYQQLLRKIQAEASAVKQITEQPNR